MPIDDFKVVVKQIGTIPENIEHDSTEEKLYSKASDLVLARCFRVLGMASRALDERGDSADILAESRAGYNYSLVADAKCFRLSRTAKNQKDFKVSNLSDWRGAENEHFSLKSLWNSSQMIARDKTLVFANAKACFLPRIDGYVAKKLGISESDFGILLGEYKNRLVDRGKFEIEFWNDCIAQIRAYSREEAIEELIKAKKLYEKISVINAYIEKLRK